jgi:hypothetical protein
VQWLRERERERESRAAVHQITARYRKTGSSPGGRAGDARN